MYPSYTSLSYIKFVVLLDEGNLYIEHEVIYFLYTTPDIILFVTKAMVVGYNFKVYT